MILDTIEASALHISEESKQLPSEIGLAFDEAIDDILEAIRSYDPNRPELFTVLNSVEKLAHVVDSASKENLPVQSLSALDTISNDSKSMLSTLQRDMNLQQPAAQEEVLQYPPTGEIRKQHVLDEIEEKILNMALFADTLPKESQFLMDPLIDKLLINLQEGNISAMKPDLASFSSILSSYSYSENYKKLGDYITDIYGSVNSWLGEEPSEAGSYDEENKMRYLTQPPIAPKDIGGFSPADHSTDAYIPYHETGTSGPPYKPLGRTGPFTPRILDDAMPHQRETGKPSGYERSWSFGPNDINTVFDIPQAEISDEARPKTGNEDEAHEQLKQIKDYFVKGSYHTLDQAQTYTDNASIMGHPIQYPGRIPAKTWWEELPSGELDSKEAQSELEDFLEMLNVYDDKDLTPDDLLDIHNIFDKTNHMREHSIIGMQKYTPEVKELIDDVLYTSAHLLSLNGETPAGLGFKKEEASRFLSPEDIEQIEKRAERDYFSPMKGYYFCELCNEPVNVGNTPEHMLNVHPREYNNWVETSQWQGGQPSSRSGIKLNPKDIEELAKSPSVPEYSSETQETYKEE